MGFTLGLSPLQVTTQIFFLFGVAGKLIEARKERISFLRWLRKEDFYKYFTVATFLLPCESQEGMILGSSR